MVAQIAEFVHDGAENNVENRRNAGFSFSPIVFKRLLFQGRYNPGLFGKGLTTADNVESMDS